MNENPLVVDVRVLMFAAMLAGLVVAVALGVLALRASPLAGRQAAISGEAPSRTAGNAQRRRRSAGSEAAAAPTLSVQTPAEQVRATRLMPRARASFATTSVLVLMLIFTLGSIGVVNGLWSKNLTIDATVQTGDINADWVQIITSDDSATISTLVLPSCDATIGGVGGEAVFGDQIAYVAITDAAPGYSCDIEASIRNTGSVPFNIIGINGILDAPNDEGLSFEDLNGAGPGVCELLDGLGNSTADPIDPGEEAIVHCKVVVDSSAEPGWTYYFAIEVCAAQWNEDPSPGGESADFDACKQPPSGTHEGPDEAVLPAPGPAA